MNKNVKRVLAIIGIVLLLALYIVTLVFALSKNPNATNLFRACIYCTIIVPILMYVIGWIYKLVKKQAEDARTKNYIVNEPENTEASVTEQKENDK